ncbi:hypothetical protein [Acholeplasma laidlawii]|uniref:hypothetical protein n=1 Tax=Acholeplasma laidlawii TaxID=2148 RepID=UPI000B525EB6|nr:hypothetical protein [Acholeplasma laidlawii]OWU88044.1 hypothetical protein A8G01_01690 [Acholeplasma laidlawii]
MYNLKSKKATKIEKVTFSDLGLLESDIEEVLRTNIDMVCDDEESLLIIGRQVKNEKNGRSDLTAIDNNGSVVLIEIKRDRKDIEGRKEAFEFQAIRYAASYATIKSVEELVKIVYAPYIEKYKEEFALNELTSYELGLRKIKEFLKVNNAIDKFNENQRIILVASEFDEQTLSAVAWLNKNKVDMSCFKLIPYKLGSEIYLDTEKLLPVANYDDFYVNLLDKSEPAQRVSKGITRRALPKIDTMLTWGVVKAGDIIRAKDREDEAILLKNGNVKVDGKELSMQVWLKNLYGWSSIQTYVFAIHKESNKTLSEIREEYMIEQELKEIQE